MRKKPSAHPPIGTREIDRLAAESYGGDTKALIADYISDERSVEHLISDMTESEADEAMLALFKLSEKKVGAKALDAELAFSMDLSLLGMTREEFLQTDEETLKAPIFRRLIRLAVILIVIVAATVICAVNHWNGFLVGILSSAAIGYCSLELSTTVLRFFRFRRTKRWYRETYLPNTAASTPSTKEDTL